MRLRVSGAALTAVLVAATALTGCSGLEHVEDRAIPPVGPLSPIAPYESAIATAQRRGLVVWLEADLLARWRAGANSFHEGVARLVDLARNPVVRGFKIADELGYGDGLDGDPAQVHRFLHDSAVALRGAAPGRKLLVDFVVPELGCAPGMALHGSGPQECRDRARSRYPSLRLENVDEYLASGDVDVINLSTGLLSEGTYRLWGTTRDAAQRAAWAEAHRRGWARHVVLNARKALAHPGKLDNDPSADLITFVDLPRFAGAAAVDVWTWRQKYKGEIVRIPDPGLTANSLWRGLQVRKNAGVTLFTHFTPSSVERDVDADLYMVASVFRGVYVAAGEG